MTGMRQVHYAGTEGAGSRFQICSVRPISLDQHYVDKDESVMMRPSPEQASSDRRGAGPSLGLSLAAARASFLTASVLTALLACAWVWATDRDFSWLHALLAVLGVALVHLAANTTNDYFDWDGSDAVNEHAGPFSGGSRHRLEGKVSKQWFAVLTGIFLAGALASGLTLAWMGRIHVLTLGLAGAAGGLLYSTWPFQLQARGMGELDIFFMFGPLITLGVAYAVTGKMEWQAFALGVPAGLLTAAILWANEIPDMKADAATGKRTLVVRLGRHGAWWGLTILFVSWVVAQLWLWAAGTLPAWSLLALLPLPVAFKALMGFQRNLSSPDALTPYQGQIIALQALSVGLCALTLVGWRVLA